MIEVTDSTIDDLMASAEQSVLLYVWAPWCGPCRMVGPALERILAKDPARFQLAKANMEVFEQGAKRFEVRATPTMIIFKNGEELCRRSGAAMESQISQWLEQNLSN